jgi:hypothetical protein
MDKNIDKFYLDWEESEEQGVVLADKIQSYLDEYGTFEGEKLIIGMWESAYDNAPDKLVKYLVENKEKFPNLKELYWGDISWEECEISWIQNTNLAPVINSFDLETLTVKGGCGLRFKDMKSSNLKKLSIISGGTGKAVLGDILKAELPLLEHLEIYMGVDDYGFDGNIQDIIPFTKKENFPKLKYLGLKNSDIEDEICEAVLKGDILPQLEELDLSYGTLGDKGVTLLLENMDKLSHLKALNIYYNYASKNLLKKLKTEMDNLGIKLSYEQNDVDLDEDDDYRYPYITE